jgi:N-methylhydantoinase A/oxoprolinase/acetone carboxylase beta subunit
LPQSRKFLANALVGEHSAYFAPDGFIPTPTFDRTKLPVGERFHGPMIVEQPDTTVVIHPGYSAYLEESGNLRIQKD